VRAGAGRDAGRGLPLHQRAHLDRATHAGRGNPRGELDRGVEVVGLEGVVPWWISSMYFIASSFIGNGRL